MTLQGGDCCSANVPRMRSLMTTRACVHVLCSITMPETGNPEQTSDLTVTAPLATCHFWAWRFSLWL